MSSTPTESRSSIIDAVKTPLGFLVLGFLIVDGTLAALAMGLVEYRTPLVWTFIISIPMFVIVVVTLAIWRPEALRGDRPLEATHADQFATDLYLALDGALSNLEVFEREEAWMTLADVIASANTNDKTYLNFRISVAERLKNLTNIHNKAARNRDSIAPE